MSIRTCAWPDCPSRFPTAQGPSVKGWQVFISPEARVLLCPFHSEQPHTPFVVRVTSRGGSTAFGCACKDWCSGRVESLVAGLREWQTHVRLTVETSG